ncbi:coiled-coil domain-containing protein 151 [Hemitrygon akajei]|uniref:coiled-coil domain-containing protein 151 n=1 Tax=Hemitrygon akajei TaxID=2704970 RepID=UPI003BF956C2
MPGQCSRVRLPVQEQIWDLQKKIQLLEGDRKAYYETSQDKIKKNKETVQHLRQEIKQLHKALAGALVSDKKLVQASFQDHHDKVALRNKSGKDIVVVMDQKVCEKAKRLNALKHETEIKKKQQMNLELQYNKNMEEAAFLQAVEENSSEEAQTLRLLENRLEKTQLKYGEASHVMKVYERLKAHLQEESVTFQKQLDTLEAEILQHRQQLKELQAINNDAQLSRDAAKAELRQQEEVMQKERREREKILSEYKKLAEEKRTQAERAERRALRATTHSDELHYERPETEDTAAEGRSNNTLAESFQWIKAVTGVTDVQDITKHYIMQGDTLKHLQQLELENKKQLVQLKEEKERLKEEYDHLKYSGESKLSSEQKLLMELQAHLEDEQKRRDKLMEGLEYISRITLSIKAGMEHLSEKMQHVEVSQDSIPAMVLSPGSDEYVLDLLSATEAKLLQLHQQLSTLDRNNMLQLMEEDEFHASVEDKLPPYNMRVKLPVAQKLDVYEDAEDDDDDDDDTDEDNDSGDNTGDIITRAMLKRQSQQIVDWKTKRKSRPKRRKAKHRSAHEGSPLPRPILVR